MTDGTVTRIELEGGFWGILTDAGEKLYPVNLEEAFHEDGLAIRFAFRDTTVMSIHMWGRPVVLDAVERR